MFAIWWAAHAPGAAGERVFRFDFPERPGALASFCASSNSDWNITLFHYRNHGSDVGRVLAGIPGASRRSKKLDAFASRQVTRLRVRQGDQ